jgi:hypothetical protein
MTPHRGKEIATSATPRKRDETVRRRMNWARGEMGFAARKADGASVKIFFHRTRKKSLEIVI